MSLHNTVSLGQAEVEHGFARYVQRQNDNRSCHEPWEDQPSPRQCVYGELEQSAGSLAVDHNPTAVH